jgi:hypothetical protein
MEDKLMSKFSLMNGGNIVNDNKIIKDVNGNLLLPFEVIYDKEEKFTHSKKDDLSVVSKDVDPGVYLLNASMFVGNNIDFGNKHQLNFPNYDPDWVHFGIKAGGNMVVQSLGSEGNDYNRQGNSPRFLTTSLTLTETTTIVTRVWGGDGDDGGVKGTAHLTIIKVGG